MNFLQTLTFNQMIIFVAGLLVVFYGILLIRSAAKVKEVQGTVVAVERQERTDDQGDLIQYYFNTVIRCKKNGNDKVKLKSGRQYHEGDRVRLEYQDGSYAFKKQAISLRRKLVICLEGFILMSIPFLQAKSLHVAANMALGLLLIVAGVACIGMHQSEKRLTIQKIPMKIVKILKVSNGKKESRFIREQVSYYPILNGILDGKSVDVIAPMSTGRKEGFKEGQSIDMEYCSDLDIFKKSIQTRGLMAIGIGLILVGSLGFIR